MFWRVKWPVLTVNMLEEGRELIFHMDPEELWHRVQNPWRWFTIFQRATALVGDNLNRRSVCWKSRGEPCCMKKMCSRPDRYLWIPDVCCRYLVGDHVGWNWLRRRGRELRRKERIFGPRPTSVTDIWSGSMSFWEILVGVDVSWGHWCPQ